MSYTCRSSEQLCALLSQHGLSLFRAEHHEGYFFILGKRDDTLSTEERLVYKLLVSMLLPTVRTSIVRDEAKVTGGVQEWRTWEWLFSEFKPYFEGEWKGSGSLKGKTLEWQTPAETGRMTMGKDAGWLSSLDNILLIAPTLECEFVEKFARSCEIASSSRFYQQEIGSLEEKLAEAREAKDALSLEMTEVQTALETIQQQQKEQCPAESSEESRVTLDDFLRAK